VRGEDDVLQSRVGEVVDDLSAVILVVDTERVLVADGADRRRLLEDTTAEKEVEDGPDELVGPQNITRARLAGRPAASVESALLDLAILKVEESGIRGVELLGVNDRLERLVGQLDRLSLEELRGITALRS
jgi:hypothetical protein